MRKILLFNSFCLAASPVWAQVSKEALPPNPSGAETNAAVSPTVTVAGKVTLPNGKGAGNAHIYLGWQGADGQMRFHKFAADAAGAFRLTAVLTPAPASWRLGIAASVPGSGFVWKAIDSTAADMEKLDLQLKPLHTLHGRLLLANGHGASHVSLKCASLSSLQNMQVLPAEEISPLSQTTTDLTGRFTIRDIPTDCAVSLSVGSGLALTDASSTPFRVSAGSPANLGVLVATSLSTLTVRVLDAVTGKPASGAPLWLFRKNTTANQLIRALPRRGGGIERDAVDEKGIQTFSGLVPGDYMLNMRGQTRDVKILANSKNSLLDMSVRSGPLMGRILDTNGVPVAKCPVTLLFPFDPPIQSGGVSQLLTDSFQILNTDRPSTENTTVTNADGTFQVPNFTWGSQAVTVRAVLGNALAEWSGSPARLGKELTLKMRPDALMTVTGRLIDPERHVLRQTTCETLHWLPSPRRTWFATAQTVHVDDQGRFRVTGLERGESFSIITPQTSHAQVRFLLTDAVSVRTETEEKLVRNSLIGRIASVRDFESPRFVTRRDTDEQDLGDTMVHPNESSEENQQIYGASSPNVLARLPGFLDAPSVADVRVAQSILTQYQSAVAAGDADTLFRLTSTASFGWSHNREEFLLHSALRPQWISTSDSVLRALPLMSRSGVTALISLNSGRGIGDGMDVDAAERELQKHPKWVFLAHNESGRLALAGTLRKESGQWRVVTTPDTSRIGIEALVLENTGQQNGYCDHMVPALDSGERAVVIQKGKQYLQTWASKDMTALFASSCLMPGPLGSPPGQLTVKPDSRADEGICPTERDEHVDLRPITGLSVWDQAHLFNLVPSQSKFGATDSRSRVLNLTQCRFGAFRSPAIDTQAFFSQKQGMFPAKLTALEYANAAGRKFLMLMAKNDTGWHVFEPALPR